MTYRFTKHAERDVLNVYVDGVARFGVSQAEVYQDQLEHTFEIIADNPRIARERVEITPRVRVHPCGLLYGISKQKLLPDEPYHQYLRCR